MSPRFPALAALSLLWIAAAPPVRAASAPPPRNITYIRGIPDTSSYFLKDSVALARVNDRVLRVREYINAYYDSYAQDRPGSDSLGRAEWLNSMINKEVVATIARRANYSFGYEERLVMRQHTERVLSNVLFQRAVLDSVEIGEDELRERYERLKTESHLRHIVFADRALAERVRADLRAGRVTWMDAVAKYSTARNDSGPAGDIGWLSQVFGNDSSPILALEPGGLSPVMANPAGFEIVQLLARRAVEPPAWEGARSNIRIQLRELRIQARSERLLALLRVQSGMQYDDANILWASSLFPQEKEENEFGPLLRLGTALPVIAPADTGRVLVGWRDGRFSLGAFLAAYSDLPPLNRLNVHAPEAFRSQLDAFVLEPYKARMALERGLDKDPLAVALIEKKREQLMVERMYRDSIESKVFVSPGQRRKYYQDHIAQFMTDPSVRYAVLVRPDSASAHALAARLRTGEKAEDIQRADSLSGVPSKLLAESMGGQGAFHALLFEELKPGTLAIRGPDQKGLYGVIQSLAYDTGRQRPFAECERYIDEAVRSWVAEELFKRFLVRHRRQFRIESHPELVMRIRLVDPVADEVF